MVTRSVSEDESAFRAFPRLRFGLRFELLTLNGNPDAALVRPFAADYLPPAPSTGRFAFKGLAIGSLIMFSCNDDR